MSSNLVPFLFVFPKFGLTFFLGENWEPLLGLLNASVTKRWEWRGELMLLLFPSECLLTDRSLWPEDSPAILMLEALFLTFKLLYFLLFTLLDFLEGTTYKWSLDSILMGEFSLEWESDTLYFSLITSGISMVIVGYSF